MISVWFITAVFFFFQFYYRHRHHRALFYPYSGLAVAAIVAGPRQKPNIKSTHTEWQRQQNGTNFSNGKRLFDDFKLQTTCAIKVVFFSLLFAVLVVVVVVLLLASFVTGRVRFCTVFFLM